MLMRRGWSYYGDMLRDDMMKNHPEINIVDFNLYNVEAFNRCENNNEVLLAFKSWESVHPLIRIIPVEWDYKMPFGILHSLLSHQVKCFYIVQIKVYNIDFRMIFHHIIP